MKRLTTRRRSALTAARCGLHAGQFACLFACLFVGGAVDSVHAAEGGSGVYALGYISPQAGLLPDAGTYASINYYAYRGSSSASVSGAGRVPIAGTHLTLPAQLDGNLKTRVESSSSLLSLTHVFQPEVFGGQAGLALLLPYASADLDLAAGANPKAAKFAGVSTLRTIVMTALISGGVAGLAGAVEVAGRASYVTLDLSPGFGYTGIVIAMLAGLRPLGVLASAILVAGIQVGADSMSRTVGVPTYIADVIVAAALIAVLIASLMTQYRIQWRAR